MSNPIEQATLALYAADDVLAEAERRYWSGTNALFPYSPYEAAQRVQQAERNLLNAIRAARPR